MRSVSVEESAIMICNCAQKIAKSEQQGKIPFHRSATSATSVISETSATSETSLPEAIESAKDYCHVVKKVKKENVTPENIGEIIMSQIPGISSVTAIAIMLRFKTVPNLIISLKNDPTCVQNISYVTMAGQTRKISKTCIASILQYFSE